MKRPERNLIIGFFLLGGLIWGLRTNRAPDPIHPLKPTPNPTPVAPAHFDAANSGSLQGRVLWQGERPKAAPFVFPDIPGVPRKQPNRANPLLPRISESGAVEDAVIFLRGIDPEEAHPWDHGPVRVEIQDSDFQVHQNSKKSRYGFVRQGDSFEMVSRQDVFHGIHGRGSEFFTRMFPKPERPLTFTARNAGIIELSSAAAYFWARSFLFVDQHPYYTRTNAAGEYRLDQVPSGEYDVVCWHPNWHVINQERDTDFTAIIRQTYAPPIERIRLIRIVAGTTTTSEFRIGKPMFDP